MLRYGFSGSSRRCYHNYKSVPWNYVSALDQMTKLNPFRALSSGRDRSRDHRASTSTAQKIPTPSPQLQQSSNAAFKATAPHPSILEYIQMIGVGKQERKSRPKRRKLSKTKNDVIGDKEFFQSHKRSQMSTRRNNAKKNSSMESSLQPPPPFAPTKQLQEGNEHSDGYQVRRFPVRAIGSAASKEDRLPANKYEIPEVALAGRSNVGKSTLLNALLYGNLLPTGTNPKDQRRPLKERVRMPKGIKAATSDKPGETREITFYQLKSELKSTEATHKMRLLLVDLPGYGFAYAKPDVAQQWKELMQHYLLDRGKTLKRVLFLIDARHGMKKADSDFLETLESVLYDKAKKRRRGDMPPIQIVLTKCDLVSQADLARRVVQVRQQLSDSLRRETSSLSVMLVSAKAGIGFNNISDNRAKGGVLELQRELAALVPSPQKEKK